MTAYFKNPENMFKLVVSVNAITTTILPEMLDLLSSFSGKMYERIETYDGDAEKEKKYTDRARSVATASHWIAVIGGKVLMFLCGYQSSQGKDKLGGKQAKLISGFQIAFSAVCFVMLFALCGMGVKIYNSAATWNEKVCEFPPPPPADTAASSEYAAKAEESEDKATALYNLYIAALVIFSVLFCINVWYAAHLGDYAPKP